MAVSKSALTVVGKTFTPSFTASDTVFLNTSSYDLSGLLDGKENASNK
jgi:hypothetical protein